MVKPGSYEFKGLTGIKQDVLHIATFNIQSVNILIFLATVNNINLHIKKLMVVILLFIIGNNILNFFVCGVIFHFF